MGFNSITDAILLKIVEAEGLAVTENASVPTICARLRKRKMLGEGALGW